MVKNRFKGERNKTLGLFGGWRAPPLIYRADYHCSHSTAISGEIRLSDLEP
jgi:hypothetical protein